MADDRYRSPGGAPRRVLVSERVAGALAELTTAYPDLTFDVLPYDGALAPTHAEAEVLWISATKDSLYQSVLDKAHRLRWIQVTAAGFDWILNDRLKELITERGMIVTRSVSFSLPIAEYVVSALLSSVRRSTDFLDAQRRREWVTIETDEFFGSTVVIFGTGAVGTEIAWRCRALGARVVGVSRSGRPAAHFDEVVAVANRNNVLSTCDAVVLAIPGTSETQQLMAFEQLRLMRPHVTLVNVGRGSVINDEDLMRALKAGEIARAVLDVFSNEPLPADSPWWDVPNTVLTPHTSFRGSGNLSRLLADFRHNLDRYLAGEPLTGTMRHPQLGY